MQIGIIIPAYNEEKNISACIESLEQFKTSGDPILVVDANSTDSTASIAQKHNVLLYSATSSSRGFAITTGVEKLLNSYPKIQIIVIAHADMQFLPNSRNVLIESLQLNPNAIWGCFGHRINDKSPFYRILDVGIKIRAKWLRLPYGDQVQYFRTMALSQIGGFPKQDRFEDLELSLRLRELSSPLYLNHPVWIPSRHWKDGIIKKTIKNWIIAAQYISNRNHVQ